MRTAAVLLQQNMKGQTEHLCFNSMFSLDYYIVIKCRRHVYIPNPPSSSRKPFARDRSGYLK